MVRGSSELSQCCSPQADPGCVCAWRNLACQPVLYTSSMPQFCPDLTVEEFDASHWLMWEKPDEINAALERFLESKVLSKE